MPLTIDVDEHPPREVVREPGMTVANAIARAFSGSHVELRPRGTNDVVKVDDELSSYNHLLGPDEADAYIEITTNGYEILRAKKAKRAQVFAGFHQPRLLK